MAESLPPLTLVKLKEALENLHFSTYVAGLLTALRTDLPEMAIALEFLQGAGRTVGAASALATDDTVTIPRPLSELEPAVLDLRRAGLVSGDMIELHVGFLRGGGDARERPERSVRYSAETVLTGLHREFSVDVVFVRALNGRESESFKPEVGISTEWHYYRRPGGFLNWLDPGLGLHAVNLDQGPEAVEIGIGLNGSLWDGLLRSGFGFNLTADEDREYWWIGFGLLGALDRVSEL